ncbi:hypothetical protein HPB50_015197 [Hyalomma asiaticum]|uniref:Uncharacterized protein n=1 Tax=Hyalomma asiaticum TaxID=266040 RepID=A0ACB7SQE6_HYAAI|nr:hypothetical protein HPB50_015197 [Hyalomma asiaticum]
MATIVRCLPGGIPGSMSRPSRGLLRRTKVHFHKESMSFGRAPLEGRVQRTQTQTRETPSTAGWRRRRRRCPPPRENAAAASRRARRTPEDRTSQTQGPYRCASLSTSSAASTSSLHRGPVRAADMSAADIAMTLDTAVKRSRRRGNGEETDKRKRPMRFSGQHDIRLLQEVVSLNPFKDTPPTTTWASISKNLEHMFAISSRRCRERTILMLDQFIKGDYPSLQRFCTSEEFSIKEQLLTQVLQQYEDGAGGYSTRIGGGYVTAAAAAAEDEEDDDFDPDRIRPRVILQEDSTSEPYTARQGSVEREVNGASAREPQGSSTSPPTAKRPRPSAGGPSPFSGNGRATPTDDDGALEEYAVSAAMGDAANGTDFPSRVVSFLVSRQVKEMRVREKELKLRREELELERAKLKLQEDRLALEKARFEIERQERELRLRSEKQERTLFMEVLKRVVSSGLTDS